MKYFTAFRYRHTKELHGYGSMCPWDIKEGVLPGKSFQEQLTLVPLHELESTQSKLGAAMDRLKWLDQYIHDYCVFVSPTHNKDGLDTENHMRGKIAETLRQVSGQNGDL